MQKHLDALKNATAHIEDGNTKNSASIIITFSNDTEILVEYWRLIKAKKHLLSSFDHQQQYGLPNPIDAPAELKNELKNKRVNDIWLDSETGDLVVEFTDSLKLQILNFTGYEVWEISFPDGSGEFSNYAR